jgi:hypothetical protein
MSVAFVVEVVMEERFHSEDCCSSEGHVLVHLEVAVGVAHIDYFWIQVVGGEVVKEVRCLVVRGLVEGTTVGCS